MISDEYKQIATLVLAKCTTKDLWFPNIGESTILGWAQVFQDSKLSKEDLLAGVDRAYLNADDGYKPLPSSIVRHARAAYFDQLNALPHQERQIMDNAHYVLEQMGFLPPHAHRASREMALGREPSIGLTEVQLAEFQRRMAEREALERAPVRAVAPLVAPFTRPVNQAISDG